MQGVRTVRTGLSEEDLGTFEDALEPKGTLAGGTDEAGSLRRVRLVCADVPGLRDHG